MLKLGLTTDERLAFEEALADHHTRRIRVQVLDLQGVVKSDISSRLLDGQVVVDSDAEVSRSLSMTLLDPNHSINFDTDSPDDGALYADRMLRVTYIVFVPALADEVEVDVFVGPVTKLSRDKDTLNVEAQGKEVLGRGAIWNPMTLQKGYGKVAAFEEIMRSRAGETRFALPAPGTARLPNAVTLDRYSTAWDEAKKIASGMGYQAFYSAEGLCTLRPYPNQATFTFRTGDGGTVISEPAVAHTIDDIKNTIVVVGATPKNAKAPIQAVAGAPADHPLSATRLAMGGRPRYLVEQIENTNLRSTSEAWQYAKRVLDDRLRETVEVSFDAVPVPHLEAGDIVNLQTDDYSVTFRLRQFSIPLGSGSNAPMTVGYTRKTTISSRLRRR